MSLIRALVVLLSIAFLTHIPRAECGIGAARAGQALQEQLEKYPLHLALSMVF